MCYTLYLNFLKINKMLKITSDIYFEDVYLFSNIYFFPCLFNILYIILYTLVGA